MNTQRASPRNGRGVSGQDERNSKQRLDDWLDEALADTFPASDPVASPPSAVATVRDDRSASMRSPDAAT